MVVDSDFQPSESQMVVVLTFIFITVLIAAIMLVFTVLPSHAVFMLVILITAINITIVSLATVTLATVTMTVITILVDDLIDGLDVDVWLVLGQVCGLDQNMRVCALKVMRLVVKGSVL